MADITPLNYKSATVYRLRTFFAIIYYWRKNPYLPFQRFRQTFDLNRIQDLSLREQAANVMAETVTEALKAGWNPETDQYPGGTEAAAPDIVKYYLPETLKAAHKSVLLKSQKLRTHSTYKSHLKLLTEYLQKKGKYKIAPDQFTAQDAQSYLDHLIIAGYAPKTANTKFDYAAGLFKWMQQSEIIKKDPFANIQRVPEPEKDDEDGLFTEQELQTIKEHLHTNGAYPELWQWYLFIHYCFMRPDSMVNIKRADIDIENKRLVVYPENHKNSRRAYKQLLQPHLDYLLPYLDEHPMSDDDYFFSNKLRPGPKRIAPTRGAELWKLHVKDTLHIKKNAYQGKHTGGTQYVEDNEGTENLKWLQNQMSHGDLQQTSIYVNKKKKIKLDESKANIKKI